MHGMHGIGGQGRRALAHLLPRALRGAGGATGAHPRPLRWLLRMLPLRISSIGEGFTLQTITYGHISRTIHKLIYVIYTLKLYDIYIYVIDNVERDAFYEAPWSAATGRWRPPGLRRCVALRGATAAPVPRRWATPWSCCGAASGGSAGPRASCARRRSQRRSKLR